MNEYCEVYAVRSSVWAAAEPMGSCVCIGCLEKRLGRQLQPKDFPNLTVTVLGDLVADEFVFGEISRVSREAPVLILKHRERSVVPGGAGNVRAIRSTRRDQFVRCEEPKSFRACLRYGKRIDGSS